MKAGVYQDICALEGVDCWVPDRETQAMLTTLIYDQIKAGQPGDETLFAKVAAAARAAAEGAEASKGSVSKFGRAKSYGEKTIGTPDAGAMSMSYFFQGLAQA